jgi:hypothetical protein
MLKAEVGIVAEGEEHKEAAAAAGPPGGVRNRAEDGAVVSGESGFSGRSRMETTNPA